MISATLQRGLFITLWSLTVFFVAPTFLRAQSAEGRAVTGVVEQFLSALGEGDYEAVPALFADNATISSPAKIAGNWTMANTTFEQWFAARMASPARSRFREPVQEFTVHIDKDLAFVRADADFIVEDKVLHNNIDYFTLIRVSGAWKFVKPLTYPSLRDRIEEPPSTPQIAFRAFR